MLKRSFIFLICLVFVFSVGCSKESGSLNVEKGDDTSAPVENIEPEFAINPLTGIENLDKDKENYRPVAIMINNIAHAQKVQTGIHNADIIYETEVEGGITRLLAVYKDISSMDKIGTVRSARYDFIDLAMGHNAIYVHHGQDSYHAGKHLNDVEHFTVDTGNGGTRITNGLASEHTLYAYGDKLWDKLNSKDFNTKSINNDTWVKFASNDETVSLPNMASSVAVKFSNSYKTTFKYEEGSGKYVRYFNDSICKDYFGGQSEKYKNIFVLNTSIYRYPNCNDGYNHMKVELNSGTGYYFVNGTYTQINWEKNGATSGFKFTNTDGSELVVNPGNSWVCIAKKTSQPIIE